MTVQKRLCYLTMRAVLPPKNAAGVRGKGPLRWRCEINVSGISHTLHKGKICATREEALTHARGILAKKFPNYAVKGEEAA